MTRLITFVGEGGLEPPRPEGHWHLKPARLPFRHSPSTTGGAYHCQSRRPHPPTLARRPRDAIRSNRIDAILRVPEVPLRCAGPIAFWVRHALCDTRNTVRPCRRHTGGLGV